MSNPNELNVSDWLESSEILDEINEESVEIKEEPFDDIADFKQGGLVYHPSDDVKDETVEITENVDDFTDVKQEKPILDPLTYFENESVEIKEDQIDDFVTMEEEEHDTLPIADIFCPSTGDSRPLTSDIDKRIHTRRQIDHLRNLLREKPNTNSLNEAVAVKRLLKLCAFCDSSYLMGTEMNEHVRSKHSEEIAKIFHEMALTKCAFCCSFYALGTPMTKHVQTQHQDKLEMSKRQVSNDVMRSGANKKGLAKCAFCCNFYEIGAGMTKHVKKEHPDELKRSTRQMYNDIVRSGAKRKLYGNQYLSNRPPEKAFKKNVNYTIGNELSEIKEEPINDFVDIKEEVIYDLPIADVFCPSTGDSRPLTINIGEEMHSKNVEQVAPRLPKQMKSTKTIIVNGSVRVAQDGAIKVDRNGPPIGPLAADWTTFAPIAHKPTHVAQDGSSIVSDCTICESLHPEGSAMDEHVRLMHPERMLTKCAFCDERLEMGAEMEKHMRLMHSERLLTKCDFCNYFYSIGAGMTNHVRWKHREEYEKTRRGTKCAFCDGFYMEGAMMEKHVRLWHTEKRTMLKKNLMKRLYGKCAFCDAFHSMGSEMDNHIRSMHPKEFSTLGIVLEKCAFCDSVYRKGDLMDHHVRLMHPEKRTMLRKQTFNN